MKENPCRKCPYAKPTCHDFCRERLEYHDQLLAYRKARLFDKLMEIIGELIDKGGNE